MTSLVDRITAVLLNGACPHAFCRVQHDKWAAHVAQRVAAELQLTEEWTVRYHEPLAYSHPRAVPPSDEILQRTREFFPGREWVHRWVSAWSAVEDTP